MVAIGGGVLGGADGERSSRVSAQVDADTAGASQVEILKARHRAVAKVRDILVIARFAVATCLR